MVPLFFASFVACSEGFSYPVDISVKATLPDLNVACDAEDTYGQDGERDEFTRVAPDDLGCAGTAVGLEPLLAWKDVRHEVRQHSEIQVTDWSDARASLGRLEAADADADYAPPGSRIVTHQFLLRPDEADAVLGSPDPITAALKWSGHELLGFEYEVQGDEKDLADQIAPDPRHLRDAGILSESYAHDPSLMLLTVAAVSVPEEALAEAPVEGLAIDADETVTIDAEVCVGSWWLFDCGQPE